MGFVIATVAGFDPLKVDAVARASYALTLWTYYQSEESEYLASLIREHEQIRMADMTAAAYHDPKRVERFRQDWRSRATVSFVEPKTVDEMSRAADDLWALHERARNRPVS